MTLNGSTRNFPGSFTSHFSSMVLALPFRAHCPTNADRFRQFSAAVGIAGVTSDWQSKGPPVNARVCATVQQMMLCRDPEAGYARYVCPGCGWEHRMPFSCKSRFCPSCGKVRVDEWVNALAQDLLNMPHLPLILTTDLVLRPFFYAQRSLLKVLLTAAAQAVREVVEALYTGVRVGMTSVVHQSGRDLGFKPHVHLVMTKGGLKDDAWAEIAEVPGGRNILKTTSE